VQQDPFELQNKSTWVIGEKGLMASSARYTQTCTGMKVLTLGKAPWTKELQRHQSLNVVFTGIFFGNFVGSESGQKQSVN
jgi:hypothetical protein